jgi:PAS domain-containing protein
MLVPLARPRRTVCGETRNCRDQRRIRVASRAPALDDHLTRMSLEAGRPTSSLDVARARYALLQRYANASRASGGRTCRSRARTCKTPSPTVRDEGYNGEGVASPNARVEAEDPVHLAVDAAEIGTWNWHIASGRIEWTPWTYQLFGFQPGAIKTSLDFFLRRVHAADRAAVQEWISQAIRDRRRTALEFRIDRADGSVRWVRSTGRVKLDVYGQVVRMVGVVEDVTDTQKGRRFTPAGAASPLTGASFSARQVAHVLGMADATVKRLAQSGELKWLRSTRKNSRRFAPADIIEYLRRGSGAAIDFASAVEGQDMSGCLVYVLEQLLEGTTFETLLDETIRPALTAGAKPFMTDLLSRLPFMWSERQRSGFPALFVQAGTPKKLEADLIACLLQAHGHEILRPAGPLEPAQIVELAERVRARLLVLAVGNGSTPVQVAAISSAGAVAAARAGTATVCVWCEGRLRVPAGVLRFRSMYELAAVLRSF